MNIDKLEKLIETLEQSLAQAKALLAEQNAAKSGEVKKYVHRDGWANKLMSHVEVSNGNAFSVLLDGTRIESWPIEDVDRFLKKGYWIPMPEKPKERKFRHAHVDFTYFENNKEYSGKYVVLKDGKFYLVLRNGYRKLIEKTQWTPEYADIFVKNRLWIEVK